jgi:hypothetical protein
MFVDKLGVGSGLAALLPATATSAGAVQVHSGCIQPLPFTQTCCVVELRLFPWQSNK